MAIMVPNMGGILSDRISGKLTKNWIRGIRMRLYSIPAALPSGPLLLSAFFISGKADPRFPEGRHDGRSLVETRLLLRKGLIQMFPMFFTS